MAEDDGGFVVFEKYTFSENLTRIHVARGCPVANAGRPVRIGRGEEGCEWYGPFETYVGASVAASELGRRDGPYDCPECRPQDRDV